MTVHNALVRAAGRKPPPNGYYREDDPRWVSPRTVPLLGQVRNQQKPQVRHVVGNPEGIPPASRAARKGTPFRRPRRSRLRGSGWN